VSSDVEARGGAGDTASEPPHPPVDGRRRQVIDYPLRLRVYMVGVVIAAAGVLAACVAIDLSVRGGGVDWVLFGVVAALLFVMNLTASNRLRLGRNGSFVTPTWGLSFALLLMGSAMGAVLALGVTTLAGQALRRRQLLRLAFNVAQTMLSLGLGALVVFAFGVRGPIFDGGLDVVEWVAMVTSATVVFIGNALFVTYFIATVEPMTMRATLRLALRASMSADAAMIVLAPVIVLSIDASLLLLPMIGVAGFLVYRTARQAMVLGHVADHDTLTQLRNRRSFVRDLEAHVGGHAGGQDPASAVVLILDLDRFKEINDRLGHETGDHVLQQFATRLVESLPPDAVAARLGGDEFAVLLEDVDAADALGVVDRLHADLKRPLQVDGFPITAGTSIGVALVPEHGSSSGPLMHAADIAMYRAKQLKTGVELFDATGSVKRGRLGLLADLVAAIERRELTVEYQPQVSMTTGLTVSIEALVRWEHPRFGRIQPAEFIRLAEQTDLIGPLTQLVIRTALGEIAPLPSEVALAVNVSARNLQDRHFATEVIDTIGEFDFPANRFEIELTESAIATEPELAQLTCSTLRRAGVRVAVDDFGTGYSCFATLRDLELDRIKIDRSLVASLGNRERDRRIVTSIIDLAHALGCDVVGEGIETETVWTQLTGLGCDLAQGFVVARPMRAELIAELLAAADPVARELVAASDRHESVYGR